MRTFGSVSWDTMLHSHLLSNDTLLLDQYSDLDLDQYSDFDRTGIGTDSIGFQRLGALMTHNAHMGYQMASTRWQVKALLLGGSETRPGI